MSEFAPDAFTCTYQLTSMHAHMHFLHASMCQGVSSSRCAQARFKSLRNLHDEGIHASHSIYEYAHTLTLCLSLSPPSSLSLYRQYKQQTITHIDPDPRVLQKFTHVFPLFYPTHNFNVSLSPYLSSSSPFVSKSLTHEPETCSLL